MNTSTYLELQLHLDDDFNGEDTDIGNREGGYAFNYD